jgi:hypothetical protein
MSTSDANPIIIVFLFVLRCLVPLLLMLGLSYLLRRLGLISDQERPTPPAGKGANGLADAAKGGHSRDHR